MNRYTAIMMADADGWAFVIPDLPGFAAQFGRDECGSTVEAIAAAESVLADFTGAMIDIGESLPDPRDPGDVAHDPEVIRDRETGDTLLLLTARPRATEPRRVNISLDTETLAKIDEWAAARKLTRSGYLAEAAVAYG